MGKEFIRSFCSYRLSEIIPNLDANALYEFTIMLTESQGRGITATMDTATVAVSAPSAASNAAILASGTKYITYYYKGSHLTALAGSGNSVNLTIEVDALQGFGANGVIVSDISVNAVSFGVNTPIALRNGAAYRYGFNGMERDDEVKGSGNSYTTTFRQYDPRLGRWFSLDPLADKFPWQSPYVGMDNNPIALSDPLGDSTKTTVTKHEGKSTYNSETGNVTVTSTKMTTNEIYGPEKDGHAVWLGTMVETKNTTATIDKNGEITSTTNTSYMGWGPNGSWDMSASKTSSNNLDDATGVAQNIAINESKFIKENGFSTQQNTARFNAARNSANTTELIGLAPIKALELTNAKGIFDIISWSADFVSPSPNQYFGHSEEDPNKIVREVKLK